MPDNDDLHMGWCKKLQAIPSVTTEWQHVTFCPDCEHYKEGACCNPTRDSGGGPCPFDDHALPLRVLAAQPIQKQMERVRDANCHSEHENETRIPRLEQAVKKQILERTGGRLQMLQTEVTPSRVTIRGVASCYYLKQLALQAALEVIGSVRSVQLEVQVVGSLR